MGKIFVPETFKTNDMDSALKLPLFLSIPHSGEKVPPQAYWLKNLAEPTLVRDVDRFVDQLYEPSIRKLKIPVIIQPWHRYVVDVNRKDFEIDPQTVKGSKAHGSGFSKRGVHWSRTTLDEPLMKEPISMQLHDQLLRDYYWPFHDAICEQIETLRKDFQQSSKSVSSEREESGKKGDARKESGEKENPDARGESGEGSRSDDFNTLVFQLDLHSMPSVGTLAHSDPGEKRAQVVISDFHGKSAMGEFKEMVTKAYKQTGFEVVCNHPYVGGGITQLYGKPERGQHCIQVELNRALYMDEGTKKILHEKARVLQLNLQKAMENLCDQLKDFLNVHK